MNEVAFTSILKEGQDVSECFSSNLGMPSTDRLTQAMRGLECQGEESGDGEPWEVSEQRKDLSVTVN